MCKSCAPFKLFEIKERNNGKKLESIQNPGLYCQAVLSGQSPFFWDDSAGVSQASDYACSVRTFRDPSYYFPPVTGAVAPYYKTPTPTAMPITTPENGAGATIIMNYVFRQQIRLWPSYQTGYQDDGPDVYFFPISDIMNDQMKLPTRWCPLLYEFTLDNYYNAITDLQSWYDNTNGWTVMTKR